MLSRAANSLYWMGRFIERAEYLARYLRVQYFTILDAPMSQNKNFVLRSIMFIANIEEDKQLFSYPQEDEILLGTSLSLSNPYSIISCINQSRENARTVRNVISRELWQEINRCYHFVNNYDRQYYATKGLYDFTTKVQESTTIIRATLDGSLLHDEVWAMVKMGVHMERSIQIIRILINKINDIKNLTLGKEGTGIEQYQWAITLRIFEAFDMCYKTYKKTPDKHNTLDFLITNPLFTRSLAFNIQLLSEYNSRLSSNKSGKKGTYDFELAKMASHHRYLTVEEVETDVDDFLGHSLNELHQLHDRLESDLMKIK